MKLQPTPPKFGLQNTRRLVCRIGTLYHRIKFLEATKYRDLRGIEGPVADRIIAHREETIVGLQKKVSLLITKLGRFPTRFERLTSGLRADIRETRVFIKSIGRRLIQRTARLITPWKPRRIGNAA